MSAIATVLRECVLSRWDGGPGHCMWCNADLVGRRTSWCSNECSGEAWRNHVWNMARHAAMRRDNNRCVECDPADCRYVALQVHHRDDKADGRHGQVSCCHHIVGLVTLCHTHHVEAHRAAQRRQRFEQLVIHMSE